MSQSTPSLKEVAALWKRPSNRARLGLPVEVVAPMLGTPQLSSALGFMARRLDLTDMASFFAHPRIAEAFGRDPGDIDARRLLSALNELGEAPELHITRLDAGLPPEVAVARPAADADSVTAWIAEHDLDRLLDNTLTVLVDRVVGSTSLKSNLASASSITLRELRSMRPTDRRFRIDELAVLQSAAIDWLREAVEAKRLRAWREELWEQRPEEARLRILGARLKDLRREVLRQLPGKVGLPPRDVTLEFEEEPPALRMEPRGNAFAQRVTRVLFIDFEDSPLRVECRCMGPGAPPCEHALHVIDYALDIVHDPRSLLRPALGRLIAVPSWTRLLTRLESHVPALLAGPSLERVVFRVAPDERESVTLALQKRGKRGYSAGRRVSAEKLLEQSPEAVAPEDRAAVAAVREYELESRRSTHPLDTHAVLPLLAGHPRVYRADDPEQRVDVVAVPLTIALEMVPAGARVAIRVGTKNVEPSTRVPAVLSHDDVAQRRVAVAEVPPSLREIVLAAAAHPAVIPEEAFDRVIAVLLRLQSDALDVRLPEKMRGRAVPADARLVARLEPTGDESLRVTFLCRPAPGGPAFAPGRGPAFSIGSDDEGRLHVRRDLDAERQAADAARERFKLEHARADAEYTFRLDRLDEALDLLSRLRDASDVVDVEWPKEAMPWELRGGATAASLHVRVQRAEEWFAVGGDVTVDGETVPLQALLDAIRAGRRFVRVSGKRFARIEAQLRAQLEDIDATVFQDRHQLAVGAAALTRLADALDDDAFDADDAALTLIQAGRVAKDFEPTVPSELQASLRDYQAEGYAWMSRLAAWGVGGVLADEMGLGKTVQTIALLLARAADGPALVVAPTSVTSNWEAELLRFAPSLTPVMYRGARRAKLLDDVDPKQVFITSYDTLARDVEQLQGTRFGVLVVDEAQAIKNARTQRAKSVRAVHAHLRVALTGTPVENHLGELYSLMRVVNPGLLGTWAHFRERYALPIERDDDARQREQLRETLRPFILRRTKRAVAPELPPRTEVIHSVELSPEERALYEAERSDALTHLADDEGQRFELLAALTRLRRLACHPRLVHPDSAVPGSKLAAFMRLARELREEDHRALVFSQFTSHLAIVREALELARIPSLYLDGSTPQPERARLVDDYQQGRVPFFLISLKAGGTGLNLTAADYVIHLDPWWNPAAEDQASDRAHRIGQERPVTVVRLVSQDTIEESVLSLHARKRDLADSLLEGANVAGKLSTTELHELIAGQSRT
ncbi:MAG: DEAD/DEAH box helicase [Sandaracinaceae bacterium]|nr:DEAD/DEAH box helicase [Sandaracinaceae bacterium]